MEIYKELLELQEKYFLPDLVPLFREVDRGRELLRHTSTSITFTRYIKDGNGGYDLGTIEECSYVKAAHYGLTPEQVIGSSNFRLMPDRKAAEKARLDDIEVMETGKPITDILEVITRPNGEKVYTLATKSPWYYFKDKKIVCGVICIARDVTLRVQAEQKLLEVATSVVEDVLNPLAKIQNLIKELDTEEHAEIKNTFVNVMQHLEKFRQQLQS